MTDKHQLRISGCLSRYSFGHRVLRSFSSFVFAGLIVSILNHGSLAWAWQDRTELRSEATWQPRSDAEIRSQFLEWAISQGESSNAETLVLQLDTLWPEQTQQQPSFNSKWADPFVLSLPILYPPAAAELSFLSSPKQTTAVPELDLPTLVPDAPFLLNQLQLVYGRWLAQNGFYDEASQQFSELTIDIVVDPAMLLFYQGIVFQRLLEKQSAIEQLERLLENEISISQRYRHLAEIAIEDLKPLESDTLNEISRLMEDIQRRQELHRSGTRVQEQEDKVVEKLDKMIEELEQQLQQQQSQAIAGNIQPGQAMEQSQRAGGIGPGNVDRREKTSGKNWGNLDAKDREAALAELARDLPAHYREIIEEYFRRIAESDRN